MSELYALILAVLAVWRVTHFLHAEDGPWDVSARLRRAAGTGIVARALDCFYCLSLWIAAPAAFMLARSAIEGWLFWPAVSAGAIVLERLIARSPAVLYREDEEN